MNKLNAKQLQTLPKDKYHDGNGLYISISKPGRGKWSFRYTINKKSREMGFGSYPDVSLSEARQLLFNNKQLLSKKIDPIDEKTGLKFYGNSKIKNSPILLIYILKQRKNLSGQTLKVNNNGVIHLIIMFILSLIVNH